jgi:hypothetical protein
MAYNDQDDDQQDGDQQGDGEQAVAQAAPAEVDAHRDLLSEALSHLGGQGVDVQSLLGQAGVNTTDPSQMSHSDLVSSTLALARAHPEVIAMISSRFPEAQGLLSSVLGGGGAAGAEGGGSGMLGGLLGRFGL